MPARLNYITASHDSFKAMMELQQHVNISGLEESLLGLTYLLVSRINGCAYCIDMHSQDLRAAGETDLRIDLVSVWEEVDIYSERERAAFAWAESVTRVSQTHVPDEVFARARAAIFRRRAGEAEPGRGHHQCLEPLRDFISQRAGTLQASSEEDGKLITDGRGIGVLRLRSSACAALTPLRMTKGEGSFGTLAFRLHRFPHSEKPASNPVSDRAPSSAKSLSSAGASPERRNQCHLGFMRWEWFW